MIDRFNRLAFIIPFALLACVLFHSCRNIEPVSITGIKGVNVSNFGMQGADFQVSIGIKNPNNIKFKVKDGDMNFFLNEWEIGKVKMEDKVIIPKKSDNVYTINVKADFSKLSLTAIPGLMSAIKGKAEVGMKGYMNVKAFGIRKKFPVDHKEKIDLGKYIPKM